MLGSRVFQCIMHGWSSSGGLASDELQVAVFGLFSLNASILGVFLLLKRLTMMANAISHTIILGVVCAYIIWFSSFPESAGDGHVSAPPETLLMMCSGIVALFTALLTQLIARHRLIKEDASNAIVFTSLFAFGVTIVSTVTRSAHAGIELLMGNPDALVMDDITRIGWATLFSLLIVSILSRGLLVAIFDPIYGKLSGMYPTCMISILLFLVATTLVTSFRAVGFIMSLAFFVAPPLVARLFSSSIWTMVLISSGVGISAAISSVALARHMLTEYDIAVSTGALAVSLLAGVFLLSAFFQVGRKKLLRFSTHISTGATDPISLGYEEKR